MLPKDAKALANTSKRIKGWFSEEATALFAWVDEIQKANGITGDIFEIGCHHGRSAVCLGEMIDPATEHLAVCDLFGSQEGNVSVSGKGDLDVFTRNMARAKERGVRLQIHQKNSGDLTVEEIGSNYRFFHVDGGHNCDEALPDLQLAAASTIEKGVIVVDDPFRPEWPGVTEAIIRFLDSNEDYSAVIVAFNKLILARSSAASLYTDALRDEAKRSEYGVGYPWHIKELPFNGKPLLIYFVPTYVASAPFKVLLRRLYRSIKRR